MAGLDQQAGHEPAGLGDGLRGPPQLREAVGSAGRPSRGAPNVTAALAPGAHDV